MAVNESQEEVRTGGDRCLYTEEDHHKQTKQQQSEKTGSRIKYRT